jgi:hypothetical protein
MKKGLLVITAILLFILGVYFVNKNPTTEANNTPGSLLSIQTGNYPWNIELDTLGNRLKAINLPALKTEGSVLHIHQHLDLYIDGKTVAIPEGIGVNESEGFISPIHTHDTTGIIHVESPIKQDFTLGQFFTIWGVKFDDQCIGGYCSENGKTLQVYLNGQKRANDFAGIVLEPHQEIVIVYGDSANTPNPIPTSYTFPAGY